MIEDDKLFKEIIIFGIKSARAYKKKQSDSKLIYNKNILETKIKSYSDEATNFNDKEFPKVGSSYICLAIILIDFVL